MLDANILLYAWNEDSPHHPPASKWVEQLFAGRDWIGLPWVTQWAFIRIATNPRVFARPLSGQEAFDTLDEWLMLPNIIVVGPGDRHAEILRRLVIEGQAVGPLLTDAALAAIAIEQGAVLASTDRGFTRFPGLRWFNPLTETGG